MWLSGELGSWLIWDLLGSEGFSSLSNAVLQVLPLGLCPEEVLASLCKLAAAALLVRFFL